jgi:hypothetical protein
MLNYWLDLGFILIYWYDPESHASLKIIMHSSAKQDSELKNKIMKLMEIK